MAAEKRGECIRFRVRLIPKEICHDSHKLLITLDPFWAVINISDYSTISQVKKKILTRLNILAKTKRLQCSHLDISKVDNDDQVKNNEIISTNFSKPFIEFQSCHLSMEDCFIPSSESSAIIRDGDLISVNAKFNIYYESKKEKNEVHFKTSGEKAEKKDTNEDYGSKNIEHFSLKSHKKRKHTKDKEQYRKSAEKNDTTISSQHKKIKLSDDFSGLLESKPAIMPAGGQKSLIVESSNGNVEPQLCSNKDFENISESSLPNPHPYKEESICQKSNLDIAKKADVSDGNISHANITGKSVCVNNSVNKVRDKYSRSLSALIHDLQLQSAEKVVVDIPGTLHNNREDNTLSNYECKQNSKRKRVRKRKDKKKAHCNVDESQKSGNISSHWNLLKNDEPLNKHIKFDDCDNTSDVDKSHDITADKNQQCKKLPIEKENSYKSRTESPFSSKEATDSNNGSGKDEIIGISEKCSSNSINQCALRSNSETFNHSLAVKYGSPIDPFDKFHQLVTQRNFTGREKEIMHSDGGHYVYYSHRKKKNDKAIAADPNSDVLINVSNVVEQSKEHASKKGLKTPSIESNNENSALLNTDDSLTKISPLHNLQEANSDKLQCLQNIQQGDFIAFRIIELSDNYNPVMSNLKEAQVLYVDKDSGLMELELIGSVTKRKLGKFDIEDDEETGNIVKHNFTELMEIKLMSRVVPKDH